MTRIGGPPQTPQPAQTSSINQAQTNATPSSNDSSAARFAVQYRDTTFGYQAQPQGPTRSQLRARKLADSLARKRRAERRTRRNVSGASDDIDDGGHAPEEHRRVTRDGGGGGSGSGQQHHGDGDGHGEAATDLPAVKSRPGATVPPLAQGALQGIAAAAPNERARENAVLDAFSDTLLDLRQRMSANPQAPLDARIHEAMLDLLAVQRAYGPFSPATLGAARQRLIEASERQAGGGRMAGAVAPMGASSPRTGVAAHAALSTALRAAPGALPASGAALDSSVRGPAVGPAVSPAISSPASPPSAELPASANGDAAQTLLADRVGRFNLLLGLLIFSASRPTTSTRLAHQTDTLQVLRGGMLARRRG
ncbi:hypothetical protein [Paraburkholderia kururiensis]|uniref:hypothetical protein n=1 Tax=Paraburkholderia kururiensis TaxID=984307 RepID=UPI0018F6FD84|nr:hypothetical protein [Paraburkholderia kururiensis]